MSEESKVTLSENQAAREYVGKPAKIGKKIGYCFLYTFLFVGIFTLISMGIYFYDNDLLADLTEDNPIIFVIAAAAAVVLGIITGLKAASSVGTEKWVIGKDGIKIYKKNELKKEFPIESFEGSKAIKNYYNGVYTGTSRFFKVVNSKGKTEELLWPFEEDEFSMAVQSIAEIRAYGGFLAKGSEARSTMDLSADAYDDKVFDCDKQNLCPAISKGKKIAFIVIGVFFLSSVCMSLVTMRDDMVIGAVGLAISAILAIIFFKLASSSNKKASKVFPEKITLKGDRIVIDSNSFNVNEIKLIQFTPINYSTATWHSYWLKIKTEEGTTEYCLGLNKSYNKTNANYPAFTSMLSDWCATRGVDCRQEL